MPWQLAAFADGQISIYRDNPNDHHSNRGDSGV
jgi:hypothetical protein